ncbi:MAG TPA: hypothetical protein VLH80_07385 [Nitrospiraceae bacterium]|nr:hypothetical protein [Nitrospiraceae bacterium]
MSTREPSALRRAIEQVNDAQRLQPITDGEVEALGNVALWRILVEPYIPKQRGMIVRPPQVDAAERVVSKVGRIVQVGCFAYQSRTTAGLELSQAREKAEVGQYWLYEMYAGQEVHLRSGHILRLLTDTELLMRVNDPDLLKGYAE